MTWSQKLGVDVVVINSLFCLFKYDFIKIKILKIKFRAIWFTPVIN